MTKIKICGLTREEDALFAAEQGADFLGFIFVPESPRSIDARSSVASIAARVRERAKPPKIVGVFRDASTDYIREIAAWPASISRNCTAARADDDIADLGMPVIKALHVGDTLARHARRPDRGVAAVRHLDDRRSGGTGRRFDWSLLAMYDRVETVLPLRRPQPTTSPPRSARPSRRHRPRQRRRERAGHQGSRQDCASVRAGEDAHDRPPLPDRRGYFGEFGGKYVPETLMAALDEFEPAYRKAAPRPRVPHGARRRSCATSSDVRRAHRGEEVRGAVRRVPALPQARRPQPHRRAQDQQRPRPGAHRQADGQEAHHRRDRRRPARRGHRHRLRAPRPRLRRLHGRGRHGAARS